MRKMLIYIVFTLSVLTISAERWEIAVDESFPPYSYVEDGEAKGSYVEIVKEVLDSINIHYKFISYPWKRVMSSTENEFVTMSLPWVESPERFDSYIMAGPVQEGKTVFIVRKNSKIEYENLEDLSGLSVGTISGYAYPEEFENADYLVKIESVVDNEMLLRKLLGKRVDLIIGDEKVMLHEAKKMKILDEIEILEKPLKAVNRYIAFPKSNSVQAFAFQEALDKLKLNKENYNAILNKYD